jgi:hypothetical protein
VDVLSGEHNFASLGVRDLLEARDQYHWQLLNKRNVVGTAIGLSRIRKTDPWPSGHHPNTLARTARPTKAERTLDNSEVRDYSSPCVLVFVDTWVDADEFGTSSEQVPFDDLVPRILFMADGRAVPVCVVKVDPAAPTETLLPERSWPSGRIGGGFPLVSTVQGEENLASVGALVTDGHTVYALTSRHVAGPHGHEVSSILGGRPVRVGASSALQLSRRPFSEVYAGFSGVRTFLTLDAGLIELDTLRDWTSQTYGLPRTGELADLNEQNVTTRLIGAEVRAFGAASGSLRGTIAALFYRYRSIGGYDDVTDFLIAPAPGTASSRPGDSGTVWHLVDGDRLRPIALQWGGQTFLRGVDQKWNFALAASLSNVLRMLDVELVVQYNTGAQPYWGKTGHYTIAALATTSAVRSRNLATLMQANTDRISFAVERLDHTTIDDDTVAAKKAGAFLPLADVPDLIWKNLPSKVKGGRDTRFSAGPEHPCHYADIDEPRPGDGKTLRQLCVADSGNVSVPVWQDYYTSLGHTAAADRGLLPFRVWQFFDAMADAVTSKRLDAYLAAAGLVAHYVGDASQPLHGSYLSDGIPGAGNRKGVHSAYESTMVDRHDQEILASIDQALTTGRRPARLHSGREAAIAVIKLMDSTAKNVPPQVLVDAFAAVAQKDDDTSVAVTDALWTQFGAGTIANLVASIRLLGVIWESAWIAGGGESAFDPADLAPRPTDVLQQLYEDPTFVPSLDLDHVAAALSSGS